MKSLSYIVAVIFVFVGCSVPQNHIEKPLDSNISSIKNRVNYEEKKTHLIHIVKDRDDTHIEFWVDPFEDEVLIDFTFSKSSNSLVNNEQNVTNIKEQKSENKKVLSNTIEEYLNHYENAQALYYAKKYNKSLIAVKKSIELNPSVAQGYKLKGTILYTLKRYDEALDEWHKALDLNPKLLDVKESIRRLEGNE